MKASVLAMCLLAACHSAKAGDTLAESIHAYNEGVRWERFGAAAVHVPPQERSEFIDELDQRAKDLRITDYEIVRVEQKSEKLAQVQIKVSWYLDSEGTLKETSAVQTWERHGKTWWVVEEKRLRGKEMPGLREDRSSEAAQAAATTDATEQ
jgi:hypothetical protein